MEKFEIIHTYKYIHTYIYFMYADIRNMIQRIVYIYKFMPKMLENL